jgi:uncharacterized membrane protein YdjX (TVP38/TMEM64 family)
LNRHAARVRQVAALVIVLSLALLIWLLPLQPLMENIRLRAERLGSGGAPAFAGVFIAFTVCCLPVWPLPFLAGAVFGSVRGTMLASASCVLAAATTFGIARGLRQTVLRRWLERSPRVQALEQTVDEADWKIVAAVRVSHFLPFGVQNYAFGFTNLGFWTFIVTTWLVTLPGMMLQVHLGHLGFSSVETWRSASPGGWQEWAWQWGGLAVLAAAAIYIGVAGRSMYRQLVKSRLEEQMQAVESGTDPCSRWPIGTILLAALAAASLAAAIGAFTMRDRLQVRLTSLAVGTSSVEETPA